MPRRTAPRPSALSVPDPSNAGKLVRLTARQRSVSDQDLLLAQKRDNRVNNRATTQHFSRPASRAGTPSCSPSLGPMTPPPSLSPPPIAKAGVGPPSAARANKVAFLGGDKVAFLASGPPASNSWSPAASSPSCGSSSGSRSSPASGPCSPSHRKAVELGMTKLDVDMAAQLKTTHMKRRDKINASMKQEQDDSCVIC
jgi:hypothetical protein